MDLRPDRFSNPIDHYHLHIGIGTLRIEGLDTAHEVPETVDGRNHYGDVMHRYGENSGANLDAQKTLTPQGYFAVQVDDMRVGHRKEQLSTCLNVLLFPLYQLLAEEPDQDQHRARIERPRPSLGH